MLSQDDIDADCEREGAHSCQHAGEDCREEGLERERDCEECRHAGRARHERPTESGDESPTLLGVGREGRDLRLLDERPALARDEGDEARAHANPESDGAGPGLGPRDERGGEPDRAETEPRAREGEREVGDAVDGMRRHARTVRGGNCRCPTEVGHRVTRD